MNYMLEELLYRKNQKGKIIIDIIKPFELTTEQVAQTPRAFNTTQIKGALDNIKFTKDFEGEDPMSLLTEVSGFLLRSFFLKLHQNGLYNRQLSLWKTLGFIKEINISNMESGFIKKKFTDIWLIDLLTSSREGCITAIYSPSINLDNLKSLTKTTIELNKHVKLKGIIYILPSSDNLKTSSALDSLVKAQDTTTRYESVIHQTKGIRLNAISITKNNDNYSFEHIYPKIKE